MMIANCNIVGTNPKNRQQFFFFFLLVLFVWYLCAKETLFISWFQFIEWFWFWKEVEFLILQENSIEVFANQCSVEGICNLSCPDKYNAKSHACFAIIKKRKYWISGFTMLTNMPSNCCWKRKNTRFRICCSCTQEINAKGWERPKCWFPKMSRNKNEAVLHSVNGRWEFMVSAVLLGVYCVTQVVAEWINWRSHGTAWGWPHSKNFERYLRCFYFARKGQIRVSWEPIYTLTSCPSSREHKWSS